jgi:2-polyprenyl-3-methyl-5-hydroxy-6-metoxy-1,4-benzoquinol methylase
LGRRALDWAYLAEGAARPSYEADLAAAEVGPKTRFVDVACGAGLAISMASARGATVGGLDASEALLAIAAAESRAATSISET